MNTTRKKIHITTLGCSKNIYDSELLMGQLIKADAQLVSSSEEADVIIINTCGFIAQAKQESIDAILEAEQLKKSDPDKKVVVCGCLSQRYAKDLKRDITTIDAYYGTEDFQNITKLTSFYDGGFHEGLCVDDGYIYLAGGSDGLQRRGLLVAGWRQAGGDRAGTV